KLLITKASAVIINIAGIPVLCEGNILHFSNTSIHVVEACSGIRSIISYLMAGFLFMYVLKKGVIRKVIMVLSAFMLAIFVNILRICGIGLLSHFYGHAAGQRFFHGFSGFILLIFGAAILFSEYLLLSHRQSTNHKTNLIH
ncbi:MAG: exosortase/archaeosortase family protein, partial [Candidatus Hodarchaeota archaeon]